MTYLKSLKNITIPISHNIVNKYDKKCIENSFLQSHFDSERLIHINLKTIPSYILIKCMPCILKHVYFKASGREKSAYLI